MGVVTDMGNSKTGGVVGGDEAWAQALLARVIQQAQRAAADAFAEHAQQLRAAASGE